MFASLLLLFASPATAETVISPGPEAVSVTVYRDPERGSGGEINLGWLQGFALISETRTIRLPAGESVIRFEGVAGGIQPVSAIVSGLPVREKNRDARLLSPAALLDAHLGRRVHLKRTSRATGVVREEDAIVRAGPDGGVVIQTKDGIEALGCSGLPEKPVYDEVPEGLSDKPTLAVTTRADQATTATVTLSYLASEFDWAANYVANVAEDGRTLDLFAWLTLANGNDESFPAARTQAVAGTLNREEEDEEANDPSLASPALSLACWPMGTTSDVPYVELPPAPPAAAYGGMEDIVVTAQRRAEVMSAAPVAVMVAEQEELGDLKLYRIPEPVTVSANGMKQVALLTKTKVPFERFYSASLSMDDENDPSPVRIGIRMKNVTARGLGLPLPSGQVALFEPAGSRPMLAGETSMGDTAIGQDVELAFGESPQVQIAQRRTDEDEVDDEDARKVRDFEIEITNANPQAVTVEISLTRYDEAITLHSPSSRLGTKNGRPLWLAKVPANGSAKLSYRLKRRVEKQRDEDEE